MRYVARSGLGLFSADSEGCGLDGDASLEIGLPWLDVEIKKLGMEPRWQSEFSKCVVAWSLQGK